MTHSTTVLISISINSSSLLLRAGYPTYSLSYTFRHVKIGIPEKIFQKSSIFDYGGLWLCPQKERRVILLIPPQTSCPLPIRPARVSRDEEGRSRSALRVQNRPTRTTAIVTTSSASHRAEYPSSFLPLLCLRKVCASGKKPEFCILLMVTPPRVDLRAVGHLGHQLIVSRRSNRDSLQRNPCLR